MTTNTTTETTRFSHVKGIFLLEVIQDDATLVLYTKVTNKVSGASYITTGWTSFETALKVVKGQYNSLRRAE